MSFNQKRALLAVFASIALFCAINYYFDFYLFGSLNKQVAGVSFAIAVLDALVVGPNLRDIEVYRRNKDSLK
ncbi:MAG TPA: hypothetical protein VK629_14810 [Steroidobacteraceae bacterium]|nr:hypothetical protein [Steroidobacteraceae bacterium]